MNSVIFRFFNLTRFFFGPLCVFYYFFYKNYLRMGRSEAYANQWASTSAVSSYIGILLWFIKPLDLIYAFLAQKTGYKSFNMFEFFYLGVMLFVIQAMARFLRKNHSSIFMNLSNIKLPKVFVIVSIILLFALPASLIFVALGKDHFWAATALMVFYYMVFYFIYFRRLLNQGSPFRRPGQ
jgi:hypothetical protein